jgi:hypothetical protein
LLLLQTAAQAGYLLPSEGSIWDGSRIRNVDGVNAYVEYAVYDTDSTAYKNSLDSIDNLGTGQYLYVYKVLNTGDGLLPISVFELIGGNPALANGIGSQADGSGTDIVPTNDHASFTWKFEKGAFTYNKQSAFLVFSSDHGPKTGNFKLSTLGDSGEEPPVGGETPEPATMAMLAAGAIGLLAKRRKNSLQ